SITRPWPLACLPCALCVCPSGRPTPWGVPRLGSPSRARVIPLGAACLESALPLTTISFVLLVGGPLVMSARPLRLLLGLGTAGDADRCALVDDGTVLCGECCGHLQFALAE